MKHYFPLLMALALCLISCEQKNTVGYISVAGKTFYADRYSLEALTCFRFTNDSVYYTLTSYHKDKGTYVQEGNVITMKLDANYPFEDHAFVFGNVLQFGDMAFSLNRPPM